VACPCLRTCRPILLSTSKRASNCSALRRARRLPSQGDPAGSSISVRIGFVKISENYPGGEMVLAYLSRRRLLRRNRGSSAAAFERATCTALDHVELVRISGNDFRDMVARFPSVRTGLEAVAAERRAANQQRMQMVSRPPHRSIPLARTDGSAEPADSGFAELHALRCHASMPAPMRMTASRGSSAMALRFDQYLVATSCRQCRDPLAWLAAPSARFAGRNSLEVIIEDWCIGCGLCAQNCPYGNINLHPFEVMVDDPERPGRKKAAIKQKATSCDLCTH